MKQTIIREDFWQQFDVPDKEILCFDFKALRLWCYKNDHELLMAHQRIIPENETTLSSEAPQDLSWARWAVEDKKIRIRIIPIFPDLPVVVKPESVFRLTEGAQARIYSRCPIWIRIEYVAKMAEILLELPSVTLSKTWFGSFIEGELCYWISSGARRQIEPDPERPYLAICPIQIIDDTDEELLIEKICLRVQNLSLFYENQQLWSNETKMFYKGVAANSQIRVGGTAPKEAASAKLVAKPRVAMKRGLTAKTFATLKDLPGLGFLGG